MKKYLFGLFAIALAVAFSAFTAPKAKKVSTQTFYWYEVASGITVSDALYVGEDKDDVLDRSLACDDNGGTVCLMASITDGAVPQSTSITNQAYFTQQTDEHRIKFDD